MARSAKTVISRTRIVRILSAAVACVAVAAPSASAGVLTASASSCEDRAWENPFLPWADVANYVQAPDAGFEQGGWSLSGGAAVVDGNESYYVRSASDSKSLSLPAGGSATSGAMCVGIEHPTLRVFSKASGTSFGSHLRVEVLFEDSAGNVHDMTVGTLGATSSWQPSPVMVIPASLLTLLPGNHTPVAFRFTAVGAGTWNVDDVYVDPYAKR
jgi:hypothetical protein